MGQQRHAWSDNETEDMIADNRQELKEEYGDKWKKHIWKIGVEEAVNRLPSLDQRLKSVRDEKDRIEDKEKKLLAKKRKQNVKSEESSLESEIQRLEDELEEWRDKDPKSKNKIEQEFWKSYKQSPAGKKSSSKDREDYLSQEKVQRRIEAQLRKQPSESEINSKISELESKLEEKRSELEELEVQTYAPY